jgi:hypothetical protein
MSDTSQGPGWWQASDAKWYPPEQAPAGTPPGQAPGGVPASTVDIGAALAYGWKKFVEYLGQIIIIVLIIAAIRIMFLLIGSNIGGDGIVGWTFNLLLTASAFFVSFMLLAGVIGAALAVTRGEAPYPGLLFKTENLGTYIVTTLLVSVGFFIGLLALCIGALIVAFFTFFYGFFVIDRGDAPVEAITNSVNMVKDNLAGVLGFVIIATVLNIVTLGLASGVTLIAGAYVYRTLNGETVAA